MKKRTSHFGSFYLRVGAISFGIGTMVYSGLEFGQYFELNRKFKGDFCHQNHYFMVFEETIRQLIHTLEYFIFSSTEEKKILNSCSRVF